MKKFFVFFSLVPALLLVFACDLRLPKAIQIKGSPELKFTANWEFDIFSDMMEGAFGSDSNDGPEINECINAPQYKTFLIRLEIFNGSVSLGSLSGDNTSISIGDQNIQIDFLGETIKLDEEVTLASSGDDPINLPFSGFGDYLYGFKLKTDDIESKLYVDGSSEIVTAITIELTGDDVYLSPSPGTTGKVSQRKSADNAHTLRELPGGGIDVKFARDFFNNSDGVGIGYEIYLAKDEVIEAAWLDNLHKINVELVIWIPLVLEAEEDGAELKFDSFEGIGSFFTSVSESGFIESFNIAIGMSANPFIGGTLVIQDTNSAYKIINPIKANALNFALGENDVKYINDNPFDPKFSIIFNEDEEIKVPKNFSITTISLTAKLSYTVELGGS